MSISQRRSHGLLWLSAPGLRKQLAWLIGGPTISPFASPVHVYQ